MNWTPVISMGIVGIAFIIFFLGIGVLQCSQKKEWSHIENWLWITGLVMIFAAFILVGFAIGVWL